MCPVNKALLGGFGPAHMTAAAVRVAGGAVVFTGLVDSFPFVHVGPALEYLVKGARLACRESLAAAAISRWPAAFGSLHGPQVFCGLLIDGKCDPYPCGQPPCSCRQVAAVAGSRRQSCRGRWKEIPGKRAPLCAAPTEPPRRLSRRLTAWPKPWAWPRCGF